MWPTILCFFDSNAQIGLIVEGAPFRPSAERKISKKEKGKRHWNYNLCFFSVLISVYLRLMKLKKQSQFLTESNVLKVINKKEIRDKNRIGHIVKTNPIKPNIG